MCLQNELQSEHFQKIYLKILFFKNCNFIRLPALFLYSGSKFPCCCAEQKFFCVDDLLGRTKGCFPLSGIFRAERNFSLSSSNQFCLRAHVQRRIPLRAEYSAQWKTVFNRKKTKKNSAPRGICRLLKNSLQSLHNQTSAS